MGFNEHRSAFYAAYAAKDYVAALRLAEAAHEAFPGQRAETWLWRACLLAALGDAEKALSALEAGMAEGAWWTAQSLDGESDLAAVRALPGFGRVRGQCEARSARARAAARPECLVIAPATVAWEPRTVIFLHWRGETARGFVEIWQPLVDEGWTLVVPQSSQPCDSTSFCWDDHALALREVRQHLEDCRGKRGIPMDRIVLAGASQGASLAVDIACEAGLPWLCVLPVFPKAYDIWRLSAVPGHTRGAVIVGEDDPANSRSLQVISQLQSAGVPVSVRSMQGIGHELPRQMVKQTGEALRELVGISAG